MKSKRSIWIAAILAFLVGAALPTVLIWNPGQWKWAEGITAGLADHTTAGAESEEKQLWTCGMHPQVIQDHPGTCPICGMNLTPLKRESASPAGTSEVKGVHVDPNFIQNFAVRVGEVQKGSIPIDIRTIGTIDYDQKSIVSVNTKFEGWIEKANVNYVGESVKRGDVLFEIYSPSLVTTQREYLAAMDYVEKLREKGDPNAVARAESLLEATRERLRYWDVTEAQIEELKSRKTPMRTLTILSPASGIVIEKMGDSLEGMKLAPGMNVFKIADLSNVWAGIEIFEHQIQYLRLGQKAVITLEAFPGRSWNGKVIYMNPSVNQKTRTLTAYVEIENSDRRLRPEMYVDVEIRVPAVSNVVRIPSEAILHTGERDVVVVKKEKGYFEPREVTLGAEGDGYAEVSRGLQPGEKIVLSSQFLIDSESNLKEAIDKMLAESESVKKSEDLSAGE
jgi:RND family efflux transporter MFP subunit